MKILLVDDHKSVIDGFNVLINLHLPTAQIINATNGRDALKMVEHELPDLMILDIKMEIMNGEEVAKYVSKHFPQIKIIILTAFTHEALITSLAKMVHGIVFKETSSHVMLNCIDAVLNGEKYFCEKATRMVLENLDEIHLMPSVALKEIETSLVKLMAAGLTNKDTAEKIGISERQVARVREKLLRKTKTKNGPELISFCFHNGLI